MLKSFSLPVPSSASEYPSLLELPPFPASHLWPELLGNLPPSLPRRPFEHLRERELNAEFRVDPVSEYPSLLELPPFPASHSAMVEMRAVTICMLDRLR
jgi:hypothetical protein